VWDVTRLSSPLPPSLPFPSFPFLFPTLPSHPCRLEVGPHCN